jgi:hypothetical protein
LLITAPLAAALVLSSCGSGDDPADSAPPISAVSLGTGTSAPDDEQADQSSTVAAEPNSATDGGVGGIADPVDAFSDCMTNSGVDMPDLPRNADGLIDIAQVLAAIDVGNSTTQLAMFACQASFDSATGGRLFQLLADPALQQALVDFSGCVREAGFPDVLDLDVVTALTRAGSAGGDGSPNSLLAATLGLDPDDPDVQAAVEGCGAEIQQQLADLGLI